MGHTNLFLHYTMKILTNFENDALEGIVSYIDPELRRCSQEYPDDNIAVFNGAYWIYNDFPKEEYKDFSRRCLLNFWSPCEFLGGYSPHNFFFDKYDYFTEVYCVCPYTCAFMNRHFGYEKFKYIPYPWTNLENITFYEYDVDACWFGGIHGDDHFQGIQSISKRPHRFINGGFNNSPQTAPYIRSIATDIGLSTGEKLAKVAKCKTNLSYNKLYLKGHSASSKVGDNFNKAFSHYREDMLPQLKVRTHEIVSCKSLLLVKKDPWNLVEDFYTEGKDFLYFSSHDELETIIDEVCSDDKAHRKMVDNAFETHKKYTVERVMEYIVKDSSDLITWKLNNVQ